ncbi:MAG: hypothetical protein WAQ99_12470 [Pyrinomonadaceae bacterium]
MASPLTSPNLFMRIPDFKRKGITMRIRSNLRHFPLWRRLPLWLALTAVLIAALLIAVPLTAGQTSDTSQVAQTTANNKNKSADSAMELQPVFSEYRGIKIGMTADEVRKLVDKLRDKGEKQDFFVLSDTETAQVFYDKDGKVRAISIDYLGKGSDPPMPVEVLGEEIQPKSDGSMYGLKRYPSAGFWIAYNRTAGDDPTVTITMQKVAVPMSN